MAPTERAMVVIEHNWTTGIPILSISLAIVAPQRVQVPQVEVKITACTPESFNSWAISSPIFLAFATEVPVPVVT